MSTVDSERHDSSVVITLNNPDAFNALAPNMAHDLVAATADAAEARLAFLEKTATGLQRTIEPENCPLTATEEPA